MAKYVFIYHGGSIPQSKEEIDAVMAAWGTWMGSLGDKLIDGGNPVGKSSTVRSDGSVTQDGGSNPVSGYGLFDADSLEQAIEMAKACPVLASGGSVELAPAIDM